MPFNCDVCGEEVSYSEKVFTLRNNAEIVICKNVGEILPTKRRKTMKESKYQRRKEEGVCTRCGSEHVAVGVTCCPSCLDYNSKLHRRLRPRYKPNGVQTYSG